MPAMERLSLMLIKIHWSAQRNSLVFDRECSIHLRGGETEAWKYTYPLAIFASWAGGVLRNHTVNTIFHQTNLASPGDPGVIKPNVDTLYSRVVLDLSKSDVVLTVPNITDGRYWVYPVYDP